MYKFGKRSLQNLSQAHEDIQTVAKAALAFGVIDFTVIETHRGQADQNRYHQLGKSQVTWPHGKHNSIPSDAADMVPYVNGKISWDLNHCLVLAGVMLAVAALAKVKIRWGGNWDCDSEPVTDQEFQDLCHYERVR